MKVQVLESYAGEFAEPGAGEKLKLAVEAAAEQAGVEPLSKAKHRGGELDVVEELTQRMRGAYQERTDALIKAVVEAYGRHAKSAD
jgi:hypothetical protein